MRLGNAAAAAAAAAAGSAAAASTFRSARKSEDWLLFVVLYSNVRNVFKLLYMMNTFVETMTNWTSTAAGGF